jgi:hypothetical protein
MTKLHIINRPIKTSEVAFKDFYDDISKDWPEKARQLQTRRWRLIRHPNRVHVI